MDSTQQSLPAPFVGREEELHRLSKAYREMVEKKKPVFVLIKGDFGVGKTALVEKFLADVKAQAPDLMIGKGICSMETELNSLIPFSQIFITLAKQGIHLKIIASNLLGFLTEVAPAWLDIVTFNLAGAAATTIDKSSRLLTRSTFSQDNVYVQFLNALNKLSSKNAIIAFIDDLHWADNSSLGLLFYLARNLKQRAILFVCTFRPVTALENREDAGFFREIHANLIRMGAVEIEINQGIDIHQYIQERYPLNGFPATFLERVKEQTDGHALYINELFTLWEENGTLIPTTTAEGKRHWSLAKNGEVVITIPQSISEVVEQRLRPIEKEPKEVLTCAAVEGNEFSAQVISRLLKVEEGQVFEYLEELERKYRVVQEIGTKETGETVLDIYQFSHHFIRDQVYGTISAGRKRILHRGVAECLQGLYSEPIEISGQLALHYREAREFVKSIQFASLAVQNEQKRYAWIEAEKWAEFGLRLIPKVPVNEEMMTTQLDLLMNSGYGFYNAGEYSQAHRRYNEALALAQESKAQPEKLAEIYSWLGDVVDYEGEEIENVMAIYEQAIECLSAFQDPVSEFHIAVRADYAYMLERKGESALAIETYQHLLEEAGTLEQTLSVMNVIAQVNNYLGIALSHLGRYAESFDAFEHCTKLAHSAGNYRLEEIALSNKADDLLELGELEECLALVTEAQKLAERIGNLDDIAYAIAIKGAVCLAQNQFLEAEKELWQAIHISEQINANWNMPYMYADLATVYLLRSQGEIARQMAEKGVGFAEKSSYQLDLGYALTSLARVQAKYDFWEAARQTFQKALECLDGPSYVHFAGRVKYYLGEANYRRGDFSSAREWAEKALADFKMLGLKHDIAKAEQLLKNLESDKKQ
jgi:predicted ATPase